MKKRNVIVWNSLKRDGAPKESCRCLILTSCGWWYQSRYSKLHNKFNVRDTMTVEEADDYSIEIKYWAYDIDTSWVKEARKYEEAED